MKCPYLDLMAGVSVNHQGGWETDETVEEAACRESLEEAGVRGILQVSFLYMSSIIPMIILILQ